MKFIITTEQVDSIAKIAGEIPTKLGLVIVDILRSLQELNNSESEDKKE